MASGGWTLDPLERVPTRRDCLTKAGGNSGSNVLSGGFTLGSLSGTTWSFSLPLEVSAYSGGADVDLRERGTALDRRARGRVGGGRIGDDDSAPDWKMLLSSHPLSSVPGPNCKDT